MAQLKLRFTVVRTKNFGFLPILEKANEFSSSFRTMFMNPRNSPAYWSDIVTIIAPKKTFLYLRCPTVYRGKTIGMTTISPVLID